MEVHYYPVLLPHPLDVTKFYCFYITFALKCRQGPNLEWENVSGHVFS